MRKILIAAILVSMISLSSAFAGGDGSEADPYQIETCSDWNSMNDYLGEPDVYVELTTDLDGCFVEPIGSTDQGAALSDVFLGTFDGNGHTVSNFEVDASATPTGGDGEDYFLFKFVDGDIQNLEIVDISLSASPPNPAVLIGDGSDTQANIEEVSIEGTGSNFVRDIQSVEVPVTIENVRVVNSNADSHSIANGATLTLENSFVANSPRTVDFGTTTSKEYYYEEGISDEFGGEELTTIEMQGSSAEFNMNFDFTNTWTTQSDDYPIQQQFVDEPPSLDLDSPADGELFPFYTDTVSLTGNISLGDYPDSEINWTVNGNVVNTQTVSTDGQVSYDFPVQEGESYDWSIQTEGEDSETRTFSVDTQTSGFYETTQNFEEEQTLVETFSEGEVNLTLNDQAFQLEDGINSFPVEETNFSVRYDLLQTEENTNPRVENLTFYSIKEEGIIEETVVDMSTGEVSEDLSARFGEDPEYIDVLVEMEDFGDNQNQKPSLDWYNLTYTADEEERSIGFDEYDVALLLMLVLFGVFALVILKS